VLIARRTVAQPSSWRGKGLHSGDPVSVTVHPGTTGIAFRSGNDRVVADPQNVTETSRCTRLGEISTIEHIMSALAAAEVTDAEIEVDGGELPALDGSALPYLEGMLEAGFESIGQTELPDLFSRIFHQEDGGVKVAVAKGTGQWRYTYDLGTRWPGVQAFEVDDVVEKYPSEIAPARTLVLAEELPIARQHGLGRGLTEESVVIFDQEGYRFKTRFADEPARHKLLDLIGDLYLSGVPIRNLSVVAEKSGHRSNVQVAAMLARAVDTH
jgi:UDP-3-O-acyl-N-acetylglucosamine deacetylase